MLCTFPNRNFLWGNFEIALNRFKVEILNVLLFIRTLESFWQLWTKRCLKIANFFDLLVRL